MSDSSGVTFTSRRVRPADRRERIVEAAARLFAEYGYPSVSLAQLAHAVGVTPPALYRHFRDREALFAETVLRAGARVRERMQLPTEDIALHELIAAATRIALEDPVTARLYLEESAYLPAAAAEQAARSRAETGDTFVRALRESRAELARGEAAFLVHAATGVLLGVTGRTHGLSPARACSLVMALAGGALEAGRPATPHQTEPPRGARHVAIPRREAVLAAAAALFRRHGFHGVGMDEIGVAAGTTGPALYRYFASKEELLVTAFRRTGHRIAGDAVRAMESAADDGDVTWRLIDTYADIAFSNEDLLVVYLREARSLPEDVRREMAAIDEDFISTWTAAVRAAAPSLTAAEARVAALAIIGVINAAVRAPGIRGEQARRAWARAAAAGATAAVTG